MFSDILAIVWFSSLFLYSIFFFLLISAASSFFFLRIFSSSSVMFYYGFTFFSSIFFVGLCSSFFKWLRLDRRNWFAPNCAFILNLVAIGLSNVTKMNGCLKIVSSKEELLVEFLPESITIWAGRPLYYISAFYWDGSVWIVDTKILIFILSVYWNFIIAGTLSPLHSIFPMMGMSGNRVISVGIRELGVIS